VNLLGSGLGPYRPRSKAARGADIFHHPEYRSAMQAGVSRARAFPLALADGNRAMLGSFSSFPELP